MENEIKTQVQMDEELGAALKNASAIITKDYLDKLESYEMVLPSHEDIDIDITECGRFYKLSKLVMNQKENFLDKLTTVVNVASSIDCSLATIIESDGHKINYYMGIVSKNARRPSDQKRRNANAAAFKGALVGNLLGSNLDEVSTEEIDYFKNNVLQNENNCYSSISGVVALRDAKQDNFENYVQGIENLVDSVRGQKYIILMIADPMDSSDIQIIKQGYEMLHTQLSTFARNTVILNESNTVTLSTAETEGITNGISEGLAMTQSKTKSKGRYFGGNVNLGVGIGLQVGIGINAGTNNGVSDTNGKTNSTMKSTQQNESTMHSTSSAKTGGKSFQLSRENRSVKTLLDKIDKNLERLDECDSFGAFDCAAYVIADDRETALTVASNYNALMRGYNSSVQASHINIWDKPEHTKILGRYLGSLVHPRFWQSKEKKLIVTPASVVSGNELAIQIGLPKKSVTGVTVVPMVPFGRNVVKESNPSIKLGDLYHMGHNEGNVQEVDIDINSLSMHTFITGSTGSGKSSTIYSILDKLMEHQVDGKDDKITFMVVEPAKGEYKDRFGYYPNVHVFGTNDKKMPLLRINPFSFPEDIHVLEHIDRLIEIFNVCWPMYAAMPAVLKDAIERAYIVSGWNLETSECRYHVDEKTPLFPSFMDVLNQINHVVDESAYSYDSRGDYKGALCTRVKSLTNGLYGQIFTNDELSPEELFEQNVIVDLSRVGSSETKSLIMGLLVMKLQEYRMSSSTGGNAPLKHVMVLEEAHNILKRTSTEQSSEGANLQGKSVEMLANSIAEMRTYGEGFIIADQAPGLMDLSVIRNTNTKIILRLPDQEDRELVGRAAGLNEDQITELSRLKTFVAAVYQNNWLEPVLCDIDKNFKELKSFKYELKEKVYQDKNQVIDYLLMPIAERSKLDDSYVREVTNEVFRMKIPSELKVAFVHYTKSSDRVKAPRLREEILYGLFNSHRAFEVTGYQENIEIWRENMIEVLEPDIRQQNLENQNKILAMLLKEQTRIDNGPETSSLFKHMVEAM